MIHQLLFFFLTSNTTYDPPTFISFFLTSNSTVNYFDGKINLGYRSLTSDKFKGMYKMNGTYACESIKKNRLFIKKRVN